MFLDRKCLGVFQWNWNKNCINVFFLFLGQPYYKMLELVIEMFKREVLSISVEDKL